MRYRQTQERLDKICVMLARQGSPLSVQELAEEGGLAIGTAHRLLGVLKEQELVQEYPHKNHAKAGRRKILYGFTEGGFIHAFTTSELVDFKEFEKILKKWGANQHFPFRSKTNEEVRSLQGYVRLYTQKLEKVERLSKSKFVVNLGVPFAEVFNVIAAKIGLRPEDIVYECVLFAIDPAYCNKFARRLVQKMIGMLENVKSVRPEGFKGTELEHRLSRLQELSQASEPWEELFRASVG